MSERIVPKPKRPWMQFSLRTLLGVVTLSAIGFALIVLAPAQRQRRAVAAVKRLGGKGDYADERENRESTFVSFLRKLVGEDYFRPIVRVDLASASISDAGLTCLMDLAELEEIDLSNTPVSDAGLVHLKRMSRLRFLLLTNTQVSDAGLAELRGLAEIQGLNLLSPR